MPWLEENLAAFLVNCVGNLLPGLCMALAIHDWCEGPLGAMQRDECSLGNEETNTIPGSFNVVAATGLRRLAIVDAAIARHGARADAVAQVNRVA
jgi:hypothetical protein